MVETRENLCNSGNERVGININLLGNREYFIVKIRRTDIYSNVVKYRPILRIFQARIPGKLLTRGLLLGRETWLSIDDN